MKKVLLSLGLISAISVSTLCADEFDVTPLIGADIGYSNFTMDATGSKIDGDNHGGLVGFKIGARNDHYRVFVDAKVYGVPDFDYVNSIGAQIQYLYPLNDKKTWEVFFGANAGLLNMKYGSLQGSRTVSEVYIGFDVGANWKVTETVSLDLGLKYMGLDISHSLGTPPVEHTMSGMTNLIIGVSFALETDKAFKR